MQVPISMSIGMEIELKFLIIAWNISKVQKQSDISIVA